MLNEFDFDFGDSLATDFSFGTTIDLSFDLDPVIVVTPGVIDVTFPPIEIVNTAPVAMDDSTQTDAGTPVTVDVLANDTDADLDTLFVLSASAGTFGTTAVNGDGTVDYTPGDGFFGIDTFTYTVFDGVDFAQATVTVTVNRAVSGVVDTLSDVIDPDDGYLSLREAIELANETDGPDTIVIGVEGSLEVDEVFTVLGDVTILGNGAILDAAGDTRIFELADGVTLALDDLTLTGGDAKKQGGAILGGDGVTLDFNAVILEGNEAKKEGGAIALGDDASVTMTGGTVAGNESKKDGGAIHVGDNARIELVGVALSDNTTKKDGGVLAAGDDAFIFIEATEIENNSVLKNGGVLALGARADLSVSTPSDVFEGTNSAQKLGDFLFAADDLSASVNGEIFTGDDLFF